MDGKKQPPRRTGISYIASFFNKKKNIDSFEALPSREQQSSESSSSLTRFFSYQELEMATKSFKQCIGVGGYGRVYLGQLPDKRMVAVKELIDDNPKQLQQFFNEVAILSRLRHENLVKLYGCTNPHNQKMLLVYEFVPNGSLFDHLYGQPQPLPWHLRMRIAIGTAEALYYLHSAKPPIIHRDIKPENILLDHIYRVKVADFGLCRQLPLGKENLSTQTPGTICRPLPLGMKNLSTQTPGTMGYQDPEYQLTITLTEKSDVYSFGVVLLELISGQKSVDVNRDYDNIYLDSMALNMIKNNELERLVDPELGYQSDADVRRKINCVAELAQECLQPKGYIRPSMGEVLKILTDLYYDMQDIECPESDEEQTLDAYCFNQQASNDGQEEANPFHRSERLGLASVFTYDELKKATNSFHISLELSRAGVNRCYLGMLDGLMVTIKLLDYGRTCKMEQFFNEVIVHSLFRHKNLVTVYGCTSPDTDKLLIVYEFVPNGTLADHLHGQRRALSWAVRLKIAIETAEALAYLHSLKTSIVHLDVNTTNILLDNNFNVKLTGLEICYFLPWGTPTSLAPAIRGTIGYLDPEYLSNGKVTKKCDIYSFGMVLLELISRDRVSDLIRGYTDTCLSLRAMMLNMIENNRLNQIVDPKLEYHSDKEVRWMINMVAELACNCVQSIGDMRPSIGEVVMILEEIRIGDKQESTS